MKRAEAKKPLIAVFDLITSCGGVQTVMSQLLPRLAGRFEIVALDPYDNPDYAALLSAAGVRRETLGPAPRRKFIGGASVLGRAARLAMRTPWIAATGIRLRRWVEARKPAAIYFNQPSAARLFPLFLGKGAPPMLYHAHGSIRGSDLRGARAISSRFASIVAVSRRTMNRLVEAGADESKITVIYNSVDAADLQGRTAETIGRLPDRKPGQLVVVHVGVVAPYKRQDLSVEALARLPENVSLWICGDVPRGGDLGYKKRVAERAARSGVEHRVSWLGWRKDVPAVVSRADICVLPSRDHNETFGMALAEAMALGKPCVGTDVGGIPEVIEDGKTGFVVPGSAEALAHALKRLADSTILRKEMGEAGRRRVEREFSPERQVRQMVAELERITGA